MYSPPTNFIWKQQSMLKFFDPVLSTNMSLILETGISEQNNMETTHPLRLKFTIYDFKTNNNIPLELVYSDLLVLYSLITNLRNESQNKLSLVIRTKNRERFLFIESRNISDKKSYIFILKDQFLPANKLAINLKLSDMTVLHTIIKNIIENYCTLTIQFQNNILLTNLNNTINNKNFNSYNKSSYNNKPIANIEPINNDNNFYDNSKDQEVNDIFGNINDDKKDITKEIEDISEDDIDYDYDDDDDEILEDTNNKKEVNSNFIINDEVLDSIELENEDSNKLLTNINNIKTTTTKSLDVSYFFDNFLNYDVNSIYKWIDAWLLLDQNSEKQMFNPLEFILDKSNVTEYDILKNNKLFYEYNYYLLCTLKDESNYYLINKKYNNIKPLYFSNLKIDRSNNELYNFIIEINLFYLLLKLFFNDFNKLTNIQINKETERLKTLDLFIKQISIPLLETIVDYDEFKKDTIVFFNYIKDSDIINYFKNIYSSVSKGGKLIINIETIYPIMDKYIDDISKINKQNTNEINNYSNEDIKNSIIEKYNFTSEENIETKQSHKLETIKKEKETKQENDYINKDDYFKIDCTEEELEEELNNILFGTE